MDTQAPLPIAPPAPESAPPPAEELSLSDHEAQFSTPDPARTPPPAGDAGGDAERDAQGRFTPRRHRAKSSQATPEDVPRIQDLTRRLRETEAERDALKRPAPAAIAAPPAPMPRAAAPVPPVPTQGPRLQPFIDALKPEEDYNTAVERHAEAMAAWTVARARQQDQQEQAARTFAQDFKARVDAAAAKYPDYVQVALEAPSQIPPGSLIDRWIWEHKTGADVLYHFQKHPQDVPRVLALPVLDQLETLALLAQQFAASSSPSSSSASPSSPSSRVPAAATGSVATPPVSPASRPPNPVRTGPLRGSDEPPGETASLREHERFYYGSTRR